MGCVASCQGCCVRVRVRVRVPPQQRTRSWAGMYTKVVCGDGQQSGSTQAREGGRRGRTHRSHSVHGQMPALECGRACMHACARLRARTTAPITSCVVGVLCCTHAWPQQPVAQVAGQGVSLCLGFWGGRTQGAGEGGRARVEAAGRVLAGAGCAGDCSRLCAGYLCAKCSHWKEWHSLEQGALAGRSSWPLDVAAAHHRCCQPVLSWWPTSPPARLPLVRRPFHNVSRPVFCSGKAPQYPP